MAAAPVLDHDVLPDVYRAICQVAKAISRDGIAKAGRNQQQGYSFRGIDDVYNALSALLSGADLCILPRMLSRSQEERTTAKGGVLFYVTVQADFDFVSARDGSRHTVTMFGEAMDSADKATNKAMSAAYKYACMQTFCIPTEGMPDADQTTPQPGSKQAAQDVAQRKIAALKRAGVNRNQPPQRVVGLVEGLPEYEYEEVEEKPSQIEHELRESIALVEHLREGKPKHTPNPFAMLRTFSDLKARYKAIGFERTYYALLGQYGVAHANEFPTNDEGMAQARCCYKEMSIDVSNREVRGK